MVSHATEKLRTLAVIGSGSVGKTSLIDHWLHQAGVNSRLGRVADGTSFCDFTAEEKEARHTLHMKFVHFAQGEIRLQVVDTPGYGDFVGEAMSALAGVDSALLVLSGVGPLSITARHLYQRARELKLPVIVFVNKLDSEQSDLGAAVENCRTLLGSECVPMWGPQGKGAGLAKVTDWLNPLSVDSAERSTLIDRLVETDEKVMEKYLDQGTVSDEELRILYARALHSGTLVPILCGSVEKGVGVTELLEHLVQFAPSPLQAPGRGGKQGDAAVMVKPGVVSGLCAQIFKTLADPYVGKLSYCRIWSGTVLADTIVTVQRTGKTEKVAHLLRPQGKEHETVTSAGPGEILAIPKIEVLETCDTLCDANTAIVIDSVKVPTPMVSLAIESKNRQDEQKLSTGLRKLTGEDLTFVAERNASTHELVLTGMTNLHLEKMIKRLKDRFHIELETRPPRVPYKETVQVNAEGHHRHKKQTGGSGQFGEVYLRVAPNERGQGFEFVDDTFGGSIPRNFLPAVEKGVAASLVTGIFAGYPIEDVRVAVYDGKHHPVDSNETSFRIAGARAFKDGFLRARPCLLEPIVDLTVEVPASAMGDITGDLNSRRGRIQGLDSVGNLQVIRAQIPLKEILTYSQDLRSMTAGEGSYSFKFSHYDVMPARLAEEVRAGFQAKDEE